MLSPFAAKRKPAKKPEKKIAGPNPIAMALMPLSQAAAWYLLYESSSAPSPSGALYRALVVTSSFYCVWALYKLYVENFEKELGHVSMGLTALAASYQSRYATIGALVLVILNFALPIFFVIPMPAKKLSKALKGTTSTLGIVWAWIFKGYMLVSLVFWAYALFKVWALQPENSDKSSHITD